MILNISIGINDRASLEDIELALRVAGGLAADSVRMHNLPKVDEDRDMTQGPSFVENISFFRSE